MLIRKLNLADFQTSGEYSYLGLYPWEGVAKTPFGAGWTHLKPGQKTKKHQHHEIETYFVAYGRGAMGVDDDRVEVGAGDVIFMPPFHSHVLENTSGEDLLFLSIFWEDMAELQGDAKVTAREGRAERVAVLAAGAAPDGKLVGPRLAADVYARYLAGFGTEVIPVREGGDGGRARTLLARLHEDGKATVRDGRLVFPLATYAEALRRYYLKARLEPQVRALCESRVAAGLDDAVLSHGGDRGLPLDVAGLEGQRLAPELEGLDAYLEAAEAGDGEAVCFFDAADAERFAVLYPALVLADEAEARLPSTLVANDAFVDDGTAPELLRHVPGDALRFHLARTHPETGPSRFDLDDLVATAEDELAAIDEWLGELSGRLADEYGGVVPATGLWTEEQRQFYEQLKRLVAEAGRAYSAVSFSPRDASEVVTRLVRSTRRFARRELHWIGVPERQDERRTSLALELAAARVLARIAAPLLPELAGRLSRELGDGGAPAWEEIPGWVPAGSRLGSLSPSGFAGLRRRLAEAGVLAGGEGVSVGGAA